MSDKIEELEEVFSLAQMMPQSLEFERAVLGALLIESDAINQVSSFLSAEDFYWEGHQIVYQAIHDLFHTNSPIEILTVNGKIKAYQDKYPDMKEIKAHYLMGLANGMGSAANIEYHARIVKQKYIGRKTIEITRISMNEAFQADKDVFDVLSTLQMKIDALNQNMGEGEKNFSDVVYETVENMKKSVSGEYVGGVPIYLRDFDKHTNGQQGGKLIIVAGRPGMGKSALMTQSIKRQGEKGHAIGVISLEMDREEIVERMFANDLLIDLTELKRGDPKKKEWQFIDDRTSFMAGLSLYICDKGFITLNEIVSLAKKWVAKYKIEELWIDYLQLIGLQPSIAKGLNREGQISLISRSLKQLAKELKIPVIALAQLSRAVEARGDKRPMLADLRESGAIEQDADMVVFLYRGSYYGIKIDGNGEAIHERELELIIAKFRGGALATLRAYYYPEFHYIGNFGCELYGLTPMSEAIEKPIPF